MPLLKRREASCDPALSLFPLPGHRHASRGDRDGLSHRRQLRSLCGRKPQRFGACLHCTADQNWLMHRLCFSVYPADQLCWTIILGLWNETKGKGQVGAHSAKRKGSLPDSSFLHTHKMKLHCIFCSASDFSHQTIIHC